MACFFLYNGNENSMRVWKDTGVDPATRFGLSSAGNVSQTLRIRFDVFGCAFLPLRLFHFDFGRDCHFF